jgi:hypothetical protein
MTSLASTTISGYVDTAIQWNIGAPANAIYYPPYSFGGQSKANGFDLNVVDLVIDKPEDETPWAAGYHVDLWFGPDANALGTVSSGINTGDFAIHQAYVTLRTPVGNGIDWKLGVFDTIIGYESFASPNNPNYTHSYGFTIEPAQHTGLLGTYVINDKFSVSAGIANSWNNIINGKNYGNPSLLTYMGALTFTAPTNAGWASGSTLTAGVVTGGIGTPAAGAATATPNTDVTSVYVGGTLNTPVTNLKLGASVDYQYVHDYATVSGGAPGDGNTWDVALYGTYQATEKLALNLRGEVCNFRNTLSLGALDPALVAPDSLYAITATAQYDLWKNVLSRLEFRWDHAEHGDAFGGQNANVGAPPPAAGNRSGAFLLAANIIYKF